MSQANSKGGSANTLSLAGKTALMSGGARRLGRCLSIELARAGADVALTYRSSQEEARETVRQVEALGRRAYALHCDLCQEASVQRAVAEAAAFFGHLDVLVNNAAVFESEALDTLSVEAWDRTFATNTRGPFLMAREALPFLKTAHGRIVNIGSMGGMRPWATHAHYCASKAALHMLTQTMAKAFAPEISVNCVAPGFLDFAEERGERADRFARRTPMQRNGSAEDVAAAVLFFAAGPAFVTGQILSVDGGLSLQ